MSFFSIVISSVWPSAFSSSLECFRASTLQSFSALTCVGTRDLPRPRDFRPPNLRPPLPRLAQPQDDEGSVISSRFPFSLLTFPAFDLSRALPRSPRLTRAPARCPVDFLELGVSDFTSLLFSAFFFFAEGFEIFVPRPPRATDEGVSRGALECLKMVVFLVIRSCRGLNEGLFFHTSLTSKCHFTVTLFRLPLLFGVGSSPLLPLPACANFLRLSGSASELEECCAPGRFRPELMGTPCLLAFGVRKADGSEDEESSSFCLCDSITDLGTAPSQAHRCSWRTSSSSTSAAAATAPLL
mmetsp:Transcript_13205/g.25040  ORF Transcript_13205/g.25040 Transcript_13205/m.25040 type:complete len:298 (+) Transcript_13205:482-1375(+)